MKCRHASLDYASARLPLSRMQGRLDMARRRFTILFTFLGVAFFISIVGFGLLYLRVRPRAERARRMRRWCLRVGGNLAETAPDDVVGYLRGVRTPTVRALVDNLRKAKVDPRDSRGAAQADRLRFAVLGQGPGSPRRDARFQDVGQAALRVPRVRRRPRVLPGHGRRQGLPDAVEPRSISIGVATYRAVPPRHARQDRRLSRICTISATTRPPSIRSPRRATPRRTRRWTTSLNRDLFEQIVSGIADGRKKQDAEVRTLIDEGPFLPEDALRAGLVDDVQYEDQVERQAAREGDSRQIDGDDYARISDSSLG